MITRIALAIAALICALSTAFAYSRTEDWVPYTSERFGFTFVYPADVFRIERTATEGDGVGFVSSDGEARMLVGALENREGHTLDSYRRYIRNASYSEFDLDYAPRGHTWFVLSGQNASRVFYEKVMFGCGGRIINSFALIYPVHAKAVFDPIVERIEDSFRIGRDCARHGY